MLFLVISTPKRSKITRELIEARLAFRKWILGLKEKVVCFYPRKGRGSVVIFSAGSKDEFEKLLEKWKTYVSVKFEIYPLQEPETAENLLRKMLGQDRGAFVPQERERERLSCPRFFEANAKRRRD